VLAHVITMMARPETILLFVARSGFSLDRKKGQRDADDAQVNQEFFHEPDFRPQSNVWKVPVRQKTVA
jgi:hypothetical protein